MIYSLQGLRVLAMLAIFLFHASLLPNGIFPVTFFFILSGFVLYLNYSPKINSTSILESFKWGINKIKRMYPIHIIALGISIIVKWDWIVSQHFGELIFKAIINITLMQGIVVIPEYSLTFNGASWYLSTLFICYLFIPFCIIKIRNINKNKLAITSIWFFELIICIILPKVSKWYIDILYISPFIRIMDIIMGMLLAKIYLERNNEKQRSYNLWGFGCILLFVITYSFSFILPGQFTRGVIYSP
ncbi:acyltransferase, partial [uncultured Clostridium sp.]|uniref:acyltransferase family protein n=1 Tax=uncultured Clostridium sp. TaxID=59620 RepID=UPI002599D543